MRGLCPCRARVRVRLVEFSYIYARLHDSSSAQLVCYGQDFTVTARRHQCQQVAPVLAAKGRFAAATCRVIVAYAGYSVYFTMSRDVFPQIAYSLRNLAPTNT